ncbi:ion channel [Planococcus lenghuensis]|uniref:Potassium channel domain-containing protein n=1 Tax=Planococcus lenghuensis TaxID=2213202 RepID=A0A1Q2L484_9BACL|nr:ion channel [Planococcus lenghuensis]AQQ55260.1 hypothetical protein B0X71_18945 [Planococcus lenghuensis]
MEWIYLVAGIGLLLFVTIDVFWTTLWVDGGAGPISSRLSRFLWKMTRGIGRGHPWLLSLAGPAVLAITLVTWIGLLWLGWLLVFSGDIHSVVDTRDDKPINWSERIYFTGYVVFTLGVGDYVPREGFWQVITAAASGNGFLFLTLGATYTLSILNSVIQQRSFASSITAIGKSGSEFVRNSWNGTDFSDINLLLSSTSSQLSTLAAQHKAYPVLYYYHCPQDEQAASVAVTVLDEALTILRFGVPEPYQPNRVLIQEARSSIEGYLDALSPRLIKTAGQVPSIANLDDIRILGLPTMTDKEFKTEVEQLQGRRRKLLNALESDARQWPSGQTGGT